MKSCLVFYDDATPMLVIALPTNIGVANISWQCKGNDTYCQELIDFCKEAIRNYETKLGSTNTVVTYWQEKNIFITKCIDYVGNLLETHFKIKFSSLLVQD